MIMEVVTWGKVVGDWAHRHITRSGTHRVPGSYTRRAEQEYRSHYAQQGGGGSGGRRLTWSRSGAFEWIRIANSRALYYRHIDVS